MHLIIAVAHTCITIVHVNIQLYQFFNVGAVVCINRGSFHLVDICLEISSSIKLGNISCIDITSAIPM